jgi:hypothetical protein
MGHQELLDIHISSPASPAGGEIVFLSWKELGLSVGLKRPPDVAESCILTLQDVRQIHQDQKTPPVFRRRTIIEE